MRLDNIIDSIAAKAPQPKEGDYIGEDGLIYCRSCHTPKQCRIEVFDITKTVPCLCKCEAEAKKQIEQEMQEFYVNSKIRELRRDGFPESDLAHATFETDNGNNEKVTRVAKNYVAKFDELQEYGKGLIFYGDVGTGKTYIAACIANALIDKGVPVLMTNFARLANTLSGMFAGKQKYIDDLNNYDLLIIDDLAAERQTEYMQEIVFNVVDARYRSGKPMIITTNMQLDKIKAPEKISDGRTFDRILERCFPVEVSGGNQRRKQIIADYDKTKELLGL